MSTSATNRQNEARLTSALLDSLALVRAWPCAEDAVSVMDMRNDPLTLRMSYHQEPKRLPGFLDEFTGNYFPPDAPPPLFADIHGQRVGFVRFRAYDEDISPVFRPALDISIMVHPAWRGKGIGCAAVRQATALAHQQGYVCVVAEIKPENAVSVRLFARAGYRHGGVHRRVISDLPQPVWVLRYFHTENT